MQYKINISFMPEERAYIFGSVPQCPVMTITADEAAKDSIVKNMLYDSGVIAVPFFVDNDIRRERYINLRNVAYIDVIEVGEDSDA